MTIRLHVERLILEGMELTPRERGSLERAVIAELTRLLGGADTTDALTRTFARGATLSRLPAESLQLAPGEVPDVFGTRVGRAAYQALLPAAAPTSTSGTTSSRRNGAEVSP